MQFQEVAPDDMWQDGRPSAAVRLHGRLRAGRSAETRLAMLAAFTEAMGRIAGVPVADVMVALVETPYENVMEGGVRLPAPGEEAAWLANFVPGSPRP
ncbi:MAG: tautomerase family protein [Acetobacteraceae bacterium]|nr:tautomerase family protein [Acetobacteraceae bacterium]